MRAKDGGSLPFLIAASFLAASVFCRDIPGARTSGTGKSTPNLGIGKSTPDNVLRVYTTKELPGTGFENDQVQSDGTSRYHPRAFRVGGGFRGSSGGRGHGGNPFGGGGGYGFHSPPAAVPNNQRFFPPGAEIVPVPRLNAKRPNEIPVGDFNYFRSEGTKIVKWADDVYASKQPDRGPVNWKETYTAEYHDSKYGFASDFQDWLVKEFGHVFTDKSYRTASHKSKQAGSPAAYVNAYSKEKMAILALDNKREIRDQNTGPQARPWNGIVWDTWKEIAGPDAGKLRVVIQSEINNKDTQALIADIHKKHNIPLSERGEFHYASADPKVRDSFVALAGTDNAKGVIFMAAYHRHELGGARVTIIHTFEERMVLVLGRPEVKRRYLQIERGPYRARLA